MPTKLKALAVEHKAQLSITSSIFETSSIFDIGIMFDIRTASMADVARVADIHVEAMDSNPLLHVQFPNSDAVTALVLHLLTNTIKCLRDPRRGVLVAQDSASGEVASFAKWEQPAATEAEAETEDWPVEANREWMDRYGELAEEVKKRVMGERPCYRKYNPRMGRELSGVPWIRIQSLPARR
jgi:hypothetical protein